MLRSFGGGLISTPVNLNSAQVNLCTNLALGNEIDFFAKKSAGCNLQMLHTVIHISKFPDVQRIMLLKLNGNVILPSLLKYIAQKSSYLSMQ